MSSVLGLRFPDRDWTQREFEKRQPWVSRFKIGGREYGGGICYDDSVRVKQFYDVFPDVRSIMELGSLEGGETFELAKRPGVRVLGIEGRQSNVEKAKFVQGLLGTKNVEFVCANLETVRMANFGAHDAVFCAGLLYHLPEPWKLISELRSVSKKLYMWTHYAAEDKANKVVNGFRGLWYKELGVQDPLSGMSAGSFWVTLPSLGDMLQQSGFAKLQVLEDEPHHIHGPRIAAAAWAEDD